MENQTSLFTKIVSIFWEPGKTFKAISEKVNIVDIIIPILLLTIVSWISLPYITPIALKEQKAKIEQSEQFANMPEEQKEVMRERMESGGKIGGYIGAPITILLSTVLLALVLWFVGNFLLGGDRKFMEMWGVAAYGSLIDLVASAVKIPLMVQKGSMKVYTSIAIFMEESATFLFRFMRSLDIFSLWKVVVLSVGLAILYKKKMSTTLPIMIILWLIYCLGAATLAGLNPFG